MISRLNGEINKILADPETKQKILDARAKAALVTQWAQDARRDGGIVVTIGDGANDIPMLEAADVSVAWHAKPLPRSRATHAIDHCGLDAVLNLFD